MIEPSHFHLHRRHISPWFRFGVPVAGLVLLWLFYREIPLLFTSLMLSWGLSYFLNPVVNFLESHTIRRGVASALALLLLIMVAYLVWHRVVTVSRDLQTRIDLNNFQKNLVSSIQSGVSWVDDKAPLAKQFFEPDPLAFDEAGAKRLTLDERIEAYVNQTIKDKMPGLALRLARFVPELAFVAVLTLYITFFLLKDGRAFKKTVIEWVPNRYFEASLKFFYEMNRRVRSYLLNMALDCTLIGSLVGVGSALVGAPYPLVFGILAGLLNTIPLLGPLLYGLTCLVITIGAGKPNEVVLGFAGVFILSRLCDDLFLMPAIYGKSHHLHPIAVVMAVLVGEHFAGVWGMLLAVPIVSIILLGLSIAEEISEDEEMAPLPASVFKPFA